MLSEQDPLELLQSRIKSLGVRSKPSISHQASTSTFYGKPAVVVQEDSDLSDSTFEPTSSTEQSESEMSQVDEDCIPEQEVVLLRQESEEDGASDYQPSEDEDGEGGERYLQRAAGMVKSSTQGYGLEFGTVYWVCKMAKFSHTENRWVEKGPVMLYISQDKTPRLLANYLYGTKSTAIDLVLYEQIDKYWRRFAGNRLVLSSFGYNLNCVADTVPVKYVDDQMSVFKCMSRVYAVQEERSTVFMLKFLSDGDLNNFGMYIQPILQSLKQSGLEKRIRTFIESQKGYPISTYSRSMEFVEKMARNGLEYTPGLDNGSVVEIVTCSWCGIRLGPFHEIVQVEDIHRHASSLARLSCSFCR